MKNWFAFYKFLLIAFYISIYHLFSLFLTAATSWRKLCPIVCSYQASVQKGYFSDQWMSPFYKWDDLDVGVFVRQQVCVDLLSPSWYWKNATWCSLNTHRNAWSALPLLEEQWYAAPAYGLPLPPWRLESSLYTFVVLILKAVILFLRMVNL